jgi:hypothetical protein
MTQTIPMASKAPNPVKRIEFDTSDELVQQLSQVTGLHGGDLNNFLWRFTAPSAIAHLKAYTVQP